MRLPSLFGVTVLVVLAAGCSIGSSSHSTLTMKQALDRARADGFVGIRGEQAVAYTCDGHTMLIANTPSGGARELYGLNFGDRGARPTLTKAGVLMHVIVFSKSADATRCAASATYSFRHQPILSGKGAGVDIQPTRQISSHLLFDPSSGW